MKCILAYLAIISLTATAQAKPESKKTSTRKIAQTHEDWLKPMDSSRFELLNIINQSCLDQFKESMVNASQVAEVLYGEKADEIGHHRIWKVLTVKRYPAPSFSTENIATLTIEWTYVKQQSSSEDIDVPDKPPKLAISCHLDTDDKTTTGRRQK